jgi:hypothetical protein
MAEEENRIGDMLPIGFRRHWTSRFTKKVVDWIAKGVEVDGLHVVVGAIEPRENPFIEELNLSFRLMRVQPADHETRWGAISDPSQPVVRANLNPPPHPPEPRFYFTFKINAWRADCPAQSRGE